jgi:hypothetical protein
MGSKDRDFVSIYFLLDVFDVLNTVGILMNFFLQYVELEYFSGFF